MLEPTDARAGETRDGSQASQAAEEMALRVDLAAAYRLVALFEWDDLVFTHITARVPGPEHHFLINPYGMVFEEITASSLVKIDMTGSKVAHSPWPVNPAGFTIHSAIHAARHDVQCVLHTHTLNGVAVSAQLAGVQPISQQSIFVLNGLSYHDYEGVALREDEKPRLVGDLGRNSYLMLRNHGLLTVGRSVAEAFLLMYTFESACAIQVRAQAGGGKLIPIRRSIIETAHEQARAVSNGVGPERLVWPGLLRRLDRIDPSYRS
jgi:ribulose-5-phosphate 4-epimerase/fuculose-1-phosphate aldolase